MPARVNRSTLNRLRRLEQRAGGQGDAYLRWQRERWPPTPKPEDREVWEAATMAEQAELMQQCTEDLVGN